MELGLFFYLLLGCVLLNTAYYFYFSKVTSYKLENPKLNNTPVSVIVCAKNEAENLKQLVPQLLNQNHPDFEIILINDASIDDTQYVIEAFEIQHHNIHMVQVVNNEAFWGNKKYALTLGIKKAKNEHLVFIDADCRPATSEWLQLISTSLSPTVSIVLGYGGYEKISKSFLNAMIRFETVFSGMQYLGYALRGNPYMGVGRNLAYTSKQFYDVSGFMSHMRVMGGDDDLFVNEAATSQNTMVALDTDSFTTSKAKKTWSEWWTQKKRHVSTAKRYKRKHKIALGAFFTSQFLFLILAIAGFIFGLHWESIFALVLLRYTIVMIVVGRGLSRFRESELIPFIPVLELVLISCQLGLFFSNTSSEPKRWK
ncbi:glycosyltransferase [Nonlabens antarcticus]|uniref:glycosyltransferase n=1 Tax=Nonlabens antarcticus TaxID=392714 RepID=UPI0018914886|nr:glycosyltransferase [Nonlabens antarcticus]